MPDDRKLPCQTRFRTPLLHRFLSWTPLKPVLPADGWGAPVIALNASSELIRQVARGGGVDKLPSAERKELPTDNAIFAKLGRKIKRWVRMPHRDCTDPDCHCQGLRICVASSQDLATAVGGTKLRAVRRAGWTRVRAWGADANVVQRAFRLVIG